MTTAPRSTLLPMNTYGRRTAPLAIQRPVPMRTTNAMSASLRHAPGSGPTLPLNSASPWALSGSSGVSTSVELPPPALPSVSHTSVPFTSVIVARVPIPLPPAPQCLAGGRR